MGTAQPCQSGTRFAIDPETPCPSGLPAAIRVLAGCPHGCQHNWDACTSCVSWLQTGDFGGPMILHCPGHEDELLGMRYDPLTRTQPP